MANDSILIFESSSDRTTEGSSKTTAFCNIYLMDELSAANKSSMKELRKQEKATPGLQVTADTIVQCTSDQPVLLQEANSIQVNLGHKMGSF